MGCGSSRAGVAVDISPQNAPSAPADPASDADARTGTDSSGLSDLPDVPPAAPTCPDSAEPETQFSEATVMHLPDVPCNQDALSHDTASDARTGTGTGETSQAVAYGCLGYDAEDTAKFEEAGLFLVSAKVTKRFFGYSRKDYANEAAPLGRVSTGGLDQHGDAGTRRKKVLLVIDVQDGYDSGFVSSLPHDTPGSLAWIQSFHPVATSYAMHSGEVIEHFAAGTRMIKLDKVWNRGVGAAAFGAVASRCVSEVRDGDYDLIVFTSDYLERRDGEEKGVFALDATSWADPDKPVARIPFDNYLTFTAGGLGADISHRIRKELPAITNTNGPMGEACGKPVLYFRKQVDDAFDDGTETSIRTGGEAWLDDVDVSDTGLPRPVKHTSYVCQTSRLDQNIY